MSSLAAGHFRAGTAARRCLQQGAHAEGNRRDLERAVKSPARRGAELVRYTSGLAMIFAVLSVASGAGRQRREPDTAVRSGPDLFTFDELETLSKPGALSGPLSDHLNRVLHTPFLSNEASARGTRPRDLSSDALGPFLRVAFWNIEEGREYERIRQALTDPDAFRRTLSSEAGPEVNPPSQESWQEIAAQLEVLRDADVLILNEVDYGVTRTWYRDVTRDLAAALNMNYTYAVEFVEVDPMVLGLEPVQLDDEEARADVLSSFTPDRGRYLGLHGSAILSRYPIRQASVRRLPLCYDWFAKELEAISLLEKGIRLGSEVAFLERVSREVRRGDRMAMIAELAVPRAPYETVTVVAGHLENKCQPECRQKQMRELMSWIRDVPNPVVLGGDLNTTGTDGAPTSARKILRDRIVDPEFYAKTAVKWSTVFVMPVLNPVKYLRNYSDPTGKNIWVLSPKKESRLFKDVRAFRFADGMAFDFRGTEAQTANDKTGTLGNSNERAGKGFHYTFALERNYGGVVGRYKLDWFFIKGFAKKPDDEKESLRFAPHYARSLQALNDANGRRLSDHCPLTVDLPFNEPRGK
jgi:endonuclease/exonuclease/phosphatase family metal-dependent hydrolase